MVFVLFVTVLIITHACEARAKGNLFCLHSEAKVPSKAGLHLIVCCAAARLTCHGLRITINNEVIMSTLRETFLNELADIYDAEKQILKALPKMIQAVEHEELTTALENHLAETKQ